MTAWARTAFDYHSDGEAAASKAEQISGCLHALSAVLLANEPRL